jgi:hypothetical protein
MGHVGLLRRGGGSGVAEHGGHVRREAVELFEPSVERGGERRGENEVIADGIALLDRVRLLDHVLRTDGQETAEPQRILDRRKFSRYHPARGCASPRSAYRSMPH